MSKYFNLIRTSAGYSIMADLSTDSAVLYDSVLAAEEDAAAHNTDSLVFDISKFEVPVPLVAPGTTILVNGQWIKAK